MRIALVISSLGCGGAERVISTMANYWAAKGREVTLITFYPMENDFYRLDPAVRRVALGLHGPPPNLLATARNVLADLFRLRRAVRRARPDAVISFIDNTNTRALLATRGLGVNVVVSERVDPARHKIRRRWERLRRVSYPWADAIVAQTGNAAEWLRGISGDAPVAVIPNPLASLDRETADGPGTARIDVSRSTVLAMGRLEPQKGFDMLITAFARAGAAHPGWRLVILGEGGERDALTALADRLGIAGRVSLPGAVKTPMPVLSRGGMFVLSSRFEGFPNALMEAMACGLPAVSFDCPSGPAGIIRDGVDGLLVPPEDVEALAAAMGRLMGDEDERKRLASRAVEVKERFGQETVMGMWDNLLEQLGVSG